MVKQRLTKSPSLSIPSSTSQSFVNTPSSIPSTPVTSVRPLLPERQLSVPGDSNVFLTALAAQERRVLELKDELRIAEVELGRLKEQWALHETSKKKNEMQKLEQLQPMSKSIYNNIEPNSLDDHVRILKEQEKRRAIQSTGKHPQRKVFSGSRHTKTLSLLLPTLTMNPTVPSPVAEKHSPRKSENRYPISKNLQQKVSPVNDKHKTLKISSPPELPRDAIIETGKQLVGELRDGLWTFFEDLKQATVGDEAVGNLPPKKPLPVQAISPTRNHTGSRSENSSNNKASGGKPVGSQTINPVSDRVLRDFERSSSPKEMIPLNNGLSAAGPVSVSKSLDDDDGWENWDSPKPKENLPTRCSTDSTTSSSIPLAFSPTTDKSSPRTSTSSDLTPRPATKPASEAIHPNKRNSIPWPSLAQLALGKTAKMMADWEQSLPPPENASGAGIGE